MRRFCVVLVSLLLAAGVAAQGFPSKTIRLVSGVSPGSASDTMARLLAEKLSVSLGQPVIVENRLGAGGAIAAKYVATAEPDGHLISVYTSAFTVAPLLNPGTFDPKDLTPVAALGTVPTVLITNPGKGYKTLADLVAAAKAKPGQVVITTAGIGSSTHMNLERFRLAAGIEVLQLHMKGAPDAMSEVLAGRADGYFAPVFSVRKHVAAGTLVPLAVGSPKRTAVFPDLPTTVEAGYPNSDYNFWVGALVSSKTPPEIAQRLNREFNAALALPDVRARVQELGVEPFNPTLAEFEAMIRKELEDNAQLIKTAGIKPN
ncbi:MAG TPA: tripartite tricarboxylate transporter substrate binding protein [Burkholderiales bacterium]|nr:tripartite tricarboxylate transporter substrate binding protein [Burkholderiales bacterium]